MRYGMNLLLWTDTMNEAILPVLDELKKIGYDAVEMPIFELDVEKYAQWGKRLDDAGLARTGGDDPRRGRQPHESRSGRPPEGVANNKLAVGLRRPPAARPWSGRSTRPWATSAARPHQG